MNLLELNLMKKHKANEEIRHLLDLEVPINDCLDDLLRNEQIIIEDYNCFKPGGSRPVIIYGLCKVH